MITVLLITSLLLNSVILFILLTRKQGDVLSNINQQIAESGDRTQKVVKEEFSLNRQELGLNFKNFSDSQNQNFHNFGLKLDGLVSSININLNQLRETIEKRLVLIQQDNSTQLEKMRATVDEKLQSTLEKRLGESFKQVSTQLESVFKGLGEMQTLAVGVGDLKKVLNNIKVRGTWGEVQLLNLLDQFLVKDQYLTNVAVKVGSNDRVEFAIKLPGKNENQSPCLLPIDSKFPLEDYQNLIKAQESGDLGQIEIYSKALENRIKSEAKYIFEKYIDPPNTTDFAILYLPIEGLYAEVSQKPGLVDSLQRQYRVTISGPTTITAILNSFQMGFRTLAVEKRSSEVWMVLNTIKKEFGIFGELLSKTQKKLQEASNVIDDASSKSHTIVSKLNKVQGIPEVTTPVEVTPLEFNANSDEVK
jgi:DNA recombination protein RmuC